MNFWKKLRLMGTAIVLLLAVIATIGALMQPAQTRPDARQPAGPSDTLPNGTKGL